MSVVSVSDSFQKERKGLQPEKAPLIKFQVTKTKIADSYNEMSILCVENSGQKAAKLDELPGGCYLASHAIRKSHKVCAYLRNTKAN